MTIIVSRFVRYLRAAMLVAAKLVVEPLLLSRKPSVRMASLDGNRYPTFLFTAFATQGPIVLPLRELGHASRLFGFWRTLRYTRLSPDPRAVKLTVARDEDPRAVEISESYFDPEISGDFCAPYFAHPDFYKNDLHIRCKSLRKTARTARLFFAGTHSVTSYRDSFLFPILSRSEIVERVRLKYGAKLDQETLYESSRGHVSRLSLNSDTRDVIDKHKLGLEDYLKAIAASDFFLCPPGFMVPHSHNVVEAMSVGAIPICNYGRYLRPQLVDGVNCLAFDTLEDLDIVLERIDALAEEEILELRKGVLDYYETHLDPAAFARAFLSETHRTRRLIVNAAEDDKSFIGGSFPRLPGKAKHREAQHAPSGLVRELTEWDDGRGRQRKSHFGHHMHSQSSSGSREGAALG